ncbi:hypothetical protein LINPERPRIM_LOCUS16341 [Linum perenne]
MLHKTAATGAFQESRMCGTRYCMLTWCRLDSEPSDVCPADS